MTPPPPQQTLILCRTKPNLEAAELESLRTIQEEKNQILEKWCFGPEPPTNPSLLLTTPPPTRNCEEQSNSTGSSKPWRLSELLRCSINKGKEIFVFLALRCESG
ncbi:hypothetical protein Droror1_Dr00022769 [Drosera rotundifolia]